MKLQVIQDDLKKAINVTSRFSSSKPQIPVLSNLLLDASSNNLSVSATNLEISVNFKIGAKVKEQGKITVSAKHLLEIVNNLSSNLIDLESKEEVLNIKTENFKSKLLGMNASDFPEIPNKVPEKFLEIPFDYLVNSLSKVVFASSYDETKPVLTGVLFFIDNGKLNLVATDGYRLSLVELGGDYPSLFKKVIIPRFIFSEIPRLVLNEKLIFSFDSKSNLVVFKTKEAVFSSRVIEGDYPDFQKIIPKGFKTKVLVDKYDLLRLIKLSSVFAKDSGNVVKISVEEGVFKIFAESQYTGSQESSIEAKVEGENIKIAFNYKFLEDFLSSVSGDNVSLELNDPGSPVVFKDIADKNYLHLIMPVKI